MTTVPAPPRSLYERDLVSIIEEYNRVTEQLRESHEQLDRQVRKLRIELADKNAQLARSERLAALGEMAAGLAHEIRNPLGGIQLFASLLEKDLGHLPEQHVLVQKILTGVIVLDGLVNDILDFGREIKLQLSDVDLAELVPACLDYLAPLTGSMKARVTTDLPETMSVQADVNQLRSALLNLLRNGIEAGGPHARTTVTVRKVRNRRAVQIRIADSGPGIPPEHMDKIFNPFFTTKETGTGLGLSMVHRIIDAHNGRAWARNLRRGGACFCIELPREAPAPKHRQATETTG